MKETEVTTIKARLVSLGFDSSVEEKLRSQLCFGSNAFVLRFAKQSGEDRCVFGVHVEAAKGTVPYYTATLRKALALSPELRRLDERMSKIDWSMLTTAMQAAGEVRVSLDMIAAAGDLLNELNAVADHSHLLYKHWADGPLESLIPGLAAIRSGQEISQRFYVVDGQPMITAEEAFKFLQNRWMEKQLAVMRRRPTQVNGDGAAENTSKKKKDKKK